MFVDHTPLGVPRKSFDETFSAVTVMVNHFFPKCAKCAAGDAPVKMKRQWIHHSAKTGKLIVCTAHDLKPRS